VNSSERSKPEKKDGSSSDPSASVSEVSPIKAQQRSWSVFGWALLAGLLIWASLPPLWLWPLAVGGVIPLVMLVQRQDWPTAHPYRQIWLASLVHCLMVYHFIRLSHWMAYFGWVLLSLYLSIYLPLFVATTRVLVHRMKWSPLIAVPVVWLGLDWLRGHIITGFTLGQLAHAMTHRTVVIQVADLVGDYGLSALIAFWGACIAYGLGLGREQEVSRRGMLVSFGLLAVTLAATLGYGASRLRAPILAEGPAAKVAIIQGSIDTLFPTSAEEDRRYWKSIETQYRELTQELLAELGPFDLILWPESKFTRLHVMPVEGETLAPSEQFKLEQRQVEVEAYALQVQGLLTQDEVFEWVQQRSTDTPITLQDFREWTAPKRESFSPMLVGCQAATADMKRFHNAALFLDDQDRVAEAYFKMHLVMFGEYIPGAKYLPFLYQLGPVAAGLTPGERPVVVESGGLKFAPNICFESTIPRVIRSQILELRRQGKEPDVLVNLTDDGWFWGSSALDCHFATHVFRAIESRKPVLVAANTGLSAVITGRGEVIEQGPRRAEATLLAEIRGESLASPYLILGDWPATLCGWWVLFVMVFGRVMHRRDRRKSVVR
jgi:apolipoprotein N-acyltransferase